MYMQENDAKSDKRGVRLPEIYALATETEINNEKRLKIAQEFKTSSGMTRTVMSRQLQWYFQDRRTSTTGKDS